LDNYQERLVPTHALRLIFLLMAAWDFLGGGVQLAFRSFLFHLKDGTELSGVLAGRAFSGALFVTGLLYVMAALHPTRYRFILWLAVAEQLIAICTGVFHGARSDVAWSGLMLPVAVAIALLILILLNFPRGLPEEAAVEEAGAEETTSEGERPPDEQ
jgi:hypothetical protein